MAKKKPQLQMDFFPILTFDVIEEIASGNRISKKILILRARLPSKDSFKEK